MTAVSPVEMPCPDCCFGHPASDPWAICATCKGLGRTWRPGAPDYGCKMTLGQRKPGEIVTIGNGDRGKILAHRKSGTPTTMVALIGEFSGLESKESTTYPSCTGVISCSHPKWFYDDDAHHNSGADEVDPMRKTKQ